jgi:hypothetical protein
MENASHPASPDPAGSDGAIVSPTPPAAPAIAEPTQAELDAHGFDPADYEWVPFPRRRRNDGWSAEKQRSFIETLADTGLVAEAARTVGMSVQSCYRLRRAPGANGFAAAWDAAIAQAGRALLDLAFERVISGEDIPIFDKAGNRIGTRRRYSERMTMFLLRGFYPERFGRQRIDTDSGERDGAAPAVEPPPPVAQTLAALEPEMPAEPHRLMAPGALSDLLANEREQERFAAAWPEQAARDAAQGAEQPAPPPDHKWDPFIPASDQSRLDPPPPPPPVHDWVAELRLKTTAEEKAAREAKRQRRKRRDPLTFD